MLFAVDHCLVVRTYVLTDILEERDSFLLYHGERDS